jgi:hypothetical protein
MGWLFTAGSTRRGQIEERTKGWERTTEDGLVVTSTCLARCYRGGVFSGVLWTVWERTFTKEGHQTQATERWIGCDLLRYQRYGWGYKDLDESMFPYFFSCPLKYLDLVPLGQYGGHAEWREQVRLHHARMAEKRRARQAAGHR